MIPNRGMGWRIPEMLVETARKVERVGKTELSGNRFHRQGARAQNLISPLKPPSQLRSGG